MNSQMDTLTAKEIIDLLRLEPLPGEGGYFRRFYYSRETVPANALPSRYGGERHWGSGIYYLLTPESFSGLHRLAGDEIWHFYLGDPIEQLRLHPDGKGEIVTIGNDLLGGLQPASVVPHGAWQSSRLCSGGKFALVGNTMAPGFEFEDYEGGNAEELAKVYPDYASTIRKFAAPHPDK